MRSVTRRTSMGIGAAAALAAMTTAPLTATACAQAPSITGPARETVLSTFKSEGARLRYLALYDAVLKQWPAPYEEIYVPTRFGRTHIIASGPKDAPPVVLLHALTASAPEWRPNVQALSTDYRVYAVDILGEANKSEPVRPLKSRRDCADWLTDVLDALVVEKASLVGNSFGGWHALNQALLAPERTDRVVLISPAVFPISFEFYIQVTKGLFLGDKKGMDDWFAGGVPWNPDNDAWGALTTLAQAEGRPVNAMSMGDITDKELKGLRAPTLLLIGEKEVVYDRKPEQVLKYAQARMPGLTAEIVPGANHLAAMAKPAEVNARILSFLKQSPPKPAD